MPKNSTNQTKFRRAASAEVRALPRVHHEGRVLFDVSEEAAKGSYETMRW
jgi:hypothetical protein